MTHFLFRFRVGETRLLRMAEEPAERAPRPDLTGELLEVRSPDLASAKAKKEVEATNKALEGTVTKRMQMIGDSIAAGTPVGPAIVNALLTTAEQLSPETLLRNSSSILRIVSAAGAQLGEMAVHQLRETQRYTCTSNYAGHGMTAHFFAPPADPGTRVRIRIVGNGRSFEGFCDEMPNFTNAAEGGFVQRGDLHFSAMLYPDGRYNVDVAPPAALEEISFVDRASGNVTGSILSTSAPLAASGIDQSRVDRVRGLANTFRTVRMYSATVIQRVTDPRRTSLLTSFDADGLRTAAGLVEPALNGPHAARAREFFLRELNAALTNVATGPLAGAHAEWRGNDFVFVRSVTPRPEAERKRGDAPVKIEEEIKKKSPTPPPVDFGNYELIDGKEKAAKEKEARERDETEFNKLWEAYQNLPGNLVELHLESENAFREFNTSPTLASFQDVTQALRDEEARLGVEQKALEPLMTLVRTGRVSAEQASNVRFVEGSRSRQFGQWYEMDVNARQLWAKTLAADRDVAAQFELRLSVVAPPSAASAKVSAADAEAEKKSVERLAKLSQLGGLETVGTLSVGQAAEQLFKKTLSDLDAKTLHELMQGGEKTAQGAAKIVEDAAQILDIGQNTVESVMKIREAGANADALVDSQNERYQTLRKWLTSQGYSLGQDSRGRNVWRRPEWEQGISLDPLAEIYNRQRAQAIGGIVGEGLRAPFSIIPLPAKIQVAMKQIPDSVGRPFGVMMRDVASRDLRAFALAMNRHDGDLVTMSPDISVSTLTGWPLLDMYCGLQMDSDSQEMQKQAHLAPEMLGTMFAGQFWMRARAQMGGYGLSESDFGNFRMRMWGDSMSRLRNGYRLRVEMGPPPNITSEEQTKALGTQLERALDRTAFLALKEMTLHEYRDTMEQLRKDPANAVLLLRSRRLGQQSLGSGGMSIADAAGLLPAGDIFASSGSHTADFGGVSRRLDYPRPLDLRNAADAKEFASLTPQQRVQYMMLYSDDQDAVAGNPRATELGRAMENYLVSLNGTSVNRVQLTVSLVRTGYSADCTQRAEVSVSDPRGTSCIKVEGTSGVPAYFAMIGGRLQWSSRSYPHWAPVEGGRFAGGDGYYMNAIANDLTAMGTRHTAESSPALLAQKRLKEMQEGLPAGSTLLYNALANRYEYTVGSATYYYRLAGHISFWRRSTEPLWRRTTEGQLPGSDSASVAFNALARRLSIA